MVWDLYITKSQGPVGLLTFDVWGYSLIMSCTEGGFPKEIFDDEGGRGGPVKTNFA